MTSFP